MNNKAENVRLLVCVSPSPFGRELVRTTHRLAEQMGAQWFAVHVASSEHEHLPPALQERIWQTLQLAEALGAETATLNGPSIVDAILDYARAQDITQIVVGRSLRSYWQRLFGGTLVDRLIRESGSIDVYVVSHELSTFHMPPSPSAWLGGGRWIAALGLVAVAALLGYPLRPWIAPYNLLTFFVFAVVISVVYLGIGPALIASLSGTLVLDYVFVAPYYRFALSDLDDVLTFIGLLTVSVVIHTFVTQARRQTQAAQAREEETAALYAFNRDLIATTDLDEILTVFMRQIHDTFGGQAAVWLFASDGDEEQCWTSGPAVCGAPLETEKARQAFQSCMVLGWGTTHAPESAFQYLPLETAQGVQGVVGLERPADGAYLTPEERRLLEAFAGQAALAIERAQYAEQVQQVQVLEAAERLQSVLLNSISHELRTPLASVTGVLSMLLADGQVLSEEILRELLNTALEETERLNRFVGNLLDISRLEADALTVSLDSCDIQDLIGAALRQMGPRLQAHSVSINLPDDLPLVPLDFVLIEQALINLLDNAIKYAPPDKQIEIDVQVRPTRLEVSVADHGPGIPEEEKAHIFEKFYRGRQDERVDRRETGIGLGLAISKGFIEAHGGELWMDSRPEGGACFTFSLPLNTEKRSVENIV